MVADYIIGRGLVTLGLYERRSRSLGPQNRRARPARLQAPGMARARRRARGARACVGGGGLSALGGGGRGGRDGPERGAGGAGGPAGSGGVRLAPPHGGTTRH